MFGTKLKADVLTLPDDFVDFYNLESAMFVCYDLVGQDQEQTKE